MSWRVEWRPGGRDFLIERDDRAPLVVVRPRVRLGEEGRLDGATVAAVIAEALARGLTHCESCGLLMARYERVEDDEDGHVDVEHEHCEGCREDADCYGCEDCDFGEDDGFDEYDPEDEERERSRSTCIGPDCLNPHMIHTRDECFTAEMAEAYMREGEEADRG